MGQRGRRPLINEEEAERLYLRYIEEELTLLDLAFEEPYSHQTIGSAFKRFGLPARGVGERTGQPSRLNMTDGIKGKANDQIKVVGTRHSYRGHRRRSKY